MGSSARDPARSGTHRSHRQRDQDPPPAAADRFRDVSSESPRESHRHYQKDQHDREQPARSRSRGSIWDRLGEKLGRESYDDDNSRGRTAQYYRPPRDADRDPHESGHSNRSGGRGMREATSQRNGGFKTAGRFRIDDDDLQSRDDDLRLKGRNTRGSRTERGGDRRSLEEGETEENLPPPWELYTSQTSGEEYYYNTETRETSWEKPVRRTLSRTPERSTGCADSMSIRRRMSPQEDRRDHDRSHGRDRKGHREPEEPSFERRSSACEKRYDEPADDLPVVRLDPRGRGDADLDRDVVTSMQVDMHPSRRNRDHYAPSVEQDLDPRNRRGDFDHGRSQDRPRDRDHNHDRERDRGRDRDRNPEGDRGNPNIQQFRPPLPPPPERCRRSCSRDGGGNKRRKVDRDGEYEAERGGTATMITLGVKNSQHDIEAAKIEGTLKAGGWDQVPETNVDHWMDIDMVKEAPPAPVEVKVAEEQQVPASIATPLDKQEPEKQDAQSIVEQRQPVDAPPQAPELAKQQQEAVPAPPDQQAQPERKSEVATVKPAADVTTPAAQTQPPPSPPQPDLSTLQRAQMIQRILAKLPENVLDAATLRDLLAPENADACATDNVDMWVGEDGFVRVGKRVGGAAEAAAASDEGSA
ncbi:uncharacterized protein EV422DRAFT_533530 [Fimicolochytrium jonesii]|uniref:uncharacterized protein n=1 Tax=Fimicolochytrium jonesii TaxID=1396493 RepID=UPI0022FF19B0|nr:uncharacterized protein EV422DRAFT_533530 [Fimicolochytrium jonesii]KAI8819572.1 hypothetical protein EV422DRAFT_533530 [Fimicolochytrium jonesii]